MESRPFLSARAQVTVVDRRIATALATPRHEVWMMRSSSGDSPKQGKIWIIAATVHCSSLLPETITTRGAQCRVVQQFSWMASAGRESFIAYLFPNPGSDPPTHTCRL